MKSRDGKSENQNSGNAHQIIHRAAMPPEKIQIQWNARDTSA